MGLPITAYLTPEAYLRAERQAEHKHEYCDGEIFAMDGASRLHNLITFNLAGVFYRQLRGKPCEAYVNDMRVRVQKTGLYTYPDVVAVCGEARFDDDQKDTLLNPSVIIEVISESTEAYDRGKKFAHYRELDSLADYLLVAQDEARIECYRRQPQGWLLREIQGREGVMQIESLACDLILAEVYEKVAFPQTQALRG